MALNDDMDKLLQLYRNAAQEAPEAAMDARILRAADHVSLTRRWMRRAAWPIAMAASILLWAVAHDSAPRPVLAHDPMAGLDAGRTRAELLRMDVTPPQDAATRFLMNATTNNATGTAP